MLTEISFQQILIIIATMKYKNTIKLKPNFILLVLKYERINVDCLIGNFKKKE